MAGHSKSSNIKHRKNAQDARRSRLFTKLTREITVAARDNPDINQNPRLRLARDRALAANLKKETIDRAIKKVTDASHLKMESVRYEGYGPNGIAILIDAFTDNRNRTASEVRYVFNRHGGSLGTSGSVAWLFHYKGCIQLDATDDHRENEIMDISLEAGVEDIIFSPHQLFSTKLITSIEDLASVTQQLEANNLLIEEASPAFLPASRELIEDESILNNIRLCIESLEAITDVEGVYTSCSWQLD